MEARKILDCGVDIVCSGGFEWVELIFKYVGKLGELGRRNAPTCHREPIRFIIFIRACC